MPRRGLTFDHTDLIVLCSLFQHYLTRIQTNIKFLLGSSLLFAYYILGQDEIIYLSSWLLRHNFYFVLAKVRFVVCFWSETFNLDRWTKEKEKHEDLVLSIFYSVISTKLTMSKPPNEDRILPLSSILTSPKDFNWLLFQLKFTYQAIVISS